MQKKFYLLEFLYLATIILAFFGGGSLLALFVETGSAAFVIFALPIIPLCMVVFYLFKKSGFGSAQLPPNEYLLNKEYGQIVSALKTSTGNVKIIDANTAYIMAKMKGLHLRICLLYFVKLTKEDFQKKKKSVNRKINQESHAQQWTNITKVGSHIRVNFIVVKQFNEYCYMLAHKNAAGLFARAEGVLNIFLSEREGILLIPAHYGLDNFLSYRKVVRIIEKALM